MQEDDKLESTQNSSRALSTSPVQGSLSFDRMAEKPCIKAEANKSLLA